MTDFQQAVVTLLRQQYPDFLILTEEAEGEFVSPGFVVLVGEASLKKEMGRRWRRQESLIVWYYPPANGQPQDQEQSLQLLLRTAARGVTSEAEREQGRLKVTLYLSQILFMDEEEAALMKKLLLEMGASK